MKHKFYLNLIIFFNKRNYIFFLKQIFIYYETFFIILY